MADEKEIAPAPPDGSEPSQPAKQEALSEASLDSILANVPGMEKYFGDETEPKKDEPGKKVAKDATAEAESEPAVTDEVLQGSEKQEEKKEPLPQALQERIDRLTAQKHEFEGKFNDAVRENTELKSKLSDAGARGPKSADPLIDVQDFRELENRWMQAKQAKAWATENLDGGLVEQGVDAQGNQLPPRELTPHEVRKFLVRCDQMLTEFIPQAKARLDAKVEFDRQADNYYTDLKKPDSDLSKTIAVWVDRLPEVLKFPDYRLIISDAVVGQQLRLQRIAAAKNGGRVKSPTLAAPSPSGAPRSQQKSVLSSELLNRMASDRSALDVFSDSLIGTTRKSS
jgi:hypothetical protein